MNIMMLLMLPTLCYASYFDNFTNLVTFNYIGENCASTPINVNVTNTVPCLLYNNISMCCKDLMRQNNYSGPLNACYNKGGNSSFSSCYEQHLTQAETNTLSALAIIGILFFLLVSVSLIYLLYACCCGTSGSGIFGRRRIYKSIN